MKALILILLAYSSLSFAQGYRMTGNFTLFGGTGSPLRANYTLTWNEENHFIEGRYSDNVFAATAGVTGTIQQDKRVFQIVLPVAEPRHGVKSLTIETSNFEGLSPNVSTTVLARDKNGAPIQSTTVLASISPDSIASLQSQEDTNCAMGFGALTGLCGLYAGSFVEEKDSASRCNLLGMRLELATSGNLLLFFNYGGNLLNLPQHDFGTVLGGPLDLNINKVIRHCGPLPATTMNSAGCQTLRLVGSFQDFGSVKNFAGTYDIRDEVTGNTCRYRLSLNREIAY